MLSRVITVLTKKRILAQLTIFLIQSLFDEPKHKKIPVAQYKLMKLQSGNLKINNYYN